jgi:hypothetical protein
MKRRIIQLLTLLLGLTAAIESRAQLPHLRIDAIFNYPDTIVQGQFYPVNILLTNIGNTPYQGPLQIAFETDSSNGAINYLYFSGNSVLIPPGDTAFFVNANGFLADSTIFRPGNNVVVVWPYSSQAIIADTFLVSTYYVTATGTGLNDREYFKKVQVFPNPTTNNLQVVSEEITIEGVRIWDMKGRLLEEQGFERRYSWQVDLTNLMPGMYLVELIGTEKRSGIYRIVKQ